MCVCVCVCVTTQIQMLKLPKCKKRYIIKEEAIEKNQILKLLKDQKILKNCLKIIEIKQNIYDKTIEKYKRNMSYIQKNNS